MYLKKIVLESHYGKWKIGHTKTCTDMLHMFKNTSSDVVMRAKFLEYCETHNDSYNIYIQMGPKRRMESPTR